MENLVQELVVKANLTEEQAGKAIQVMKDFFMSKIPPAFAPMVENFFQSGNTPDMDDAMGKLGF